MESALWRAIGDETTAKSGQGRAAAIWRAGAIRVAKGFDCNPTAVTRGRPPGYLTARRLWGTCCGARSSLVDAQHRAAWPQDEVGQVGQDELVENQCDGIGRPRQAEHQGCVGGAGERRAQHGAAGPTGRWLSMPHSLPKLYSLPSQERADGVDGVAAPGDAGAAGGDQGRRPGAIAARARSATCSGPSATSDQASTRCPRRRRHRR